MKQCVRCAEDQYPNSDQDHCLSKVVTFLAFGDPLGVVLACTALGLSVLTAGALGVFLKHRDTPIVKAHNWALSYILLISLILCCLCSFLFLGRPYTATCILQQMTFGVIFTVAISTTLAKTITVVLAFKVTTPGRTMWLWLLSGTPSALTAICSFVQGTFCAVWLGTSPPFMDIDAHLKAAPLIIMCNKGSAMMLYLSLGYWGSLALLSFTLAFLGRNLLDTFKEARWLTFSMLVFCSVWITFLPVYNRSMGKVMVVLEVFCILASSAGLLGYIFLPSCCHILLKSERNTLPKLRGKNQLLQKINILGGACVCYLRLFESLKIKQNPESCLPTPCHVYLSVLASFFPLIWNALVMFITSLDINRCSALTLLSLILFFNEYTFLSTSSIS